MQWMFDRIGLTGLTAAAEALFPENDLGAPDYRTTDLVARLLEYLRVLPARQRSLIQLLFVFFELMAPLLSFQLRRFSSLPVARRETLVRDFRKSRFFALRILGDAMKATLTMLYMSHPLSLAYIGERSECHSGSARVAPRKPAAESHAAGEAP